MFDQLGPAFDCTVRVSNFKVSPTRGAFAESLLLRLHVLVVAPRFGVVTSARRPTDDLFVARVIATEPEGRLAGHSSGLAKLDTAGRSVSARR